MGGFRVSSCLGNVRASFGDTFQRRENQFVGSSDFHCFQVPGINQPIDCRPAAIQKVHSKGNRYKTAGRFVVLWGVHASLHLSIDVWVAGLRNALVQPGMNRNIFSGFGPMET